MSITFAELYARFIEHHSDPHNDAPRKGGTLGNYKKKKKKIMEWLESYGWKDLPADQFTIGKAKLLLREMLARGFSRNYSVRMAKMPGQVFAWACREELLDKNPLEHLKLKRDNQRKIIHLDPNELQAVRDHRFTSIYLSRVRDIFVFSCYTGVDYGCSMALRREHIITHRDGRQYIIKPREKAQLGFVNEAIIPLFTEPRDILERYGYKLPRIANGTYNRMLKEVMAIAGINKHVTTHTARRTFAMIKLNHEGYSMETVSKMLGHTKVKTTEESYARVNIERISRELATRAA